MHTFPILNYANQGVCSWKIFAEAIVNELKYKTTIQGIPTSAYTTLAKRPKYSILDTERIEKELGVTIPTWQESLKKCIQIFKSDGSL
jgi:dTDP-4-dehydrorhamnose reductase